MLSGGGAKGGYEVGVMKALFDGASPATGFAPLRVEVFTGTSVGAFNATFMASRWRASSADALRELEAVWRTRMANTREGCGNGVFRIRGLPLQGLDIGCLRHPFEDLAELARDGVFFVNFAVIRGMNLISSRAPVKNRIAETIDVSAMFSVTPFDNLVRDTVDVGALHDSPLKLTIAASNWRDGSLRLFTKADIERLGPGTILASAAIPGIFPPVVVDGTPYVDGGVLNNTPLRPAIRSGADVVHVVYLDPLVEDIPFPQLPNTLNTIYRMYAVLQSSNVTNDIMTAQSVNRALEIARGDGGGGAQAVQLAANVARRRRRGGRPYRNLTIHRYRPLNDLGGGEGLLDFSSRNIEYLINLGYRDAVSHDCQAAGCDIPG